MRTIRFLVPLAFAAGLSACAQSSPVSTVSDNFSTTYSPDDFARQASVAPVPVVVHGRAAGLDHREMVQAVTAGMQGNTWGADTHFVAESSKTASANNASEYSVVIMINGPSDITSAQLCAEPATKAGNTPIDSGNVHLIGALCRYDAAVTGVEAKADGIQGASDPKLQQLISSASNELTAPNPGGRKLL